VTLTHSQTLEQKIKNKKELFGVVVVKLMLHQTLVVALGFGIDHQLSSTAYYSTLLLSA
jgi:hypothetical protein